MFCVLLWVIVHAWLALSRDVAQSKALRLCATAYVDSKIPSYRDVVDGPRPIRDCRGTLGGRPPPGGVSPSGAPPSHGPN